MIFKEYNSKERDSSYGTERNILWNNSQSSVIQLVSRIYCPMKEVKIIGFYKTQEATKDIMTIYIFKTLDLILTL